MKVATLFAIMMIQGSLTRNPRYNEEIAGNSRRALLESGELNDEEMSLIMNKTQAPSYEPGKYQIADEVKVSGEPKP